MATEEEVERARQFWLNSDTKMGLRLMAIYAGREVKRTVDAIVAKLRDREAELRNAAVAETDQTAIILLGGANAFKEAINEIKREFGGAK